MLPMISKAMSVFQSKLHRPHYRIMTRHDGGMVCLSERGCAAVSQSEEEQGQTVDQ